MVVPPGFFLCNTVEVWYAESRETWCSSLKPTFYQNHQWKDVMIRAALQYQAVCPLLIVYVPDRKMKLIASDGEGGQKKVSQLAWVK